MPARTSARQFNEDVGLTTNAVEACQIGFLTMLMSRASMAWVDTLELKGGNGMGQ